MHRHLAHRRSICALFGLLTASLGLSLHGGCKPATTAGDAGGPAGASAGFSRGQKRAPAKIEVADYALKGVVTRTEPEKQHVRIRHEEIPNLMPAMTMRFEYKDRDLLAELRPGDEVEGTLHVVKVDGAVESWELRGLTVTKPAPKEMVLRLSNGKAELVPAPRPLQVGDAVPDFAMTMQDGKLVKLSQLRGTVIVLTFIYTRCPLPDFCPLMDKKFSALAQAIALFPERARHIRLISLSFDPEHDTPEVLRKHALIRGATPPLWTYAVATHDELAKVAPGLGLAYGPSKDEFIHNLCTAVIDRDGKLARVDIGTEPNRRETADLLKTVYSLIPTSGK